VFVVFFFLCVVLAGNMAVCIYSVLMICWVDLGNSENLYEKQLQCMNSRHSSDLKRSNWFLCVCDRFCSWGETL